MNHYYGDGCKPPHRCPGGTCQRAYNNVCKVCNNGMPTPQNNEGWENELSKKCPWLYKGAKYRIICSFIGDVLKDQREGMVKILKELRKQNDRATCQDAHREPRDISASEYDCSDIHIGRSEALSDAIQAINKQDE